MRGLCALVVVASLALSGWCGLGGGRASSAEPPVVGLFFAPTGAPPFAARVREAFVAGLAARGIPIVELARPNEGAPVTAVPPATTLGEAEAAYRAYRFADAVAALSRLERQAEATGGEGMDARQLADIFVYRGLARLELKEAGAAWEDFVRAARIDPTRSLDAAEFPPRAVAAHRRAIAEAAQVPRAELVVRAPTGASVWIDGRAASQAMTVPLGTHFVRVAAAGYAPWGAVVTVAAARLELAPPLTADAPPGREALLGAAPPTARAVVLGAMARGAAGEWRFVARRDDRDGSSSAVEEALADETSAATAARRAVDRLLAPAVAPTAAIATTAATGPPPPRARRRWWIWAVVGGVVAAAAIAVPLGVVYGTPSTPSAGGALPQP